MSTIVYGGGVNQSENVLRNENKLTEHCTHRRHFGGGGGGLRGHRPPHFSSLFIFLLPSFLQIEISQDLSVQITQCTWSETLFKMHPNRYLGM